MKLILYPLFLVMSVVTIGKSQILFLDNWKPIPGVKKITASHYSATVSLDEIDINNQLIKILGIFSPEGILTEEKISYKHDDTPILFIIRYRDDQKIKEILFNYGTNGGGEVADFYSRLSFDYNNIGQLITVTRWCNLKSRQCTIYDPTNYNIQKSEYIEDHWKLVVRLSNIYDPNGLIAKSTLEKSENSYDHDSYLNVYDEILEAVHPSDVYDIDIIKLNLPVREEDFLDTEINEKSVKFLSNKTLEYKLMERSYKYEFNSKGDWIKCVVFNGSIPVRIMLREIEYY